MSQKVYVVVINDYCIDYEGWDDTWIDSIFSREDLARKRIEKLADEYRASIDEDTRDISDQGNDILFKYDANSGHSFEYKEFTLDSEES